MDRPDRRLPDIPLLEFERRIRDFLPRGTPREAISQEAITSLFQHYQELRRWNPRLSLVGPGTAGEVLARHYGESVAALELLQPSDRRLVDLGSGAGFPGLVLAALRAELEVTLVEPRQRKWAFLRAATRRGGLSCRCLDARVERPLPMGFPSEFDVVTCRALALAPEIYEELYERSPRGRILLWWGSSDPELPPWLMVTRAIPLEGSESRRILEMTPATL